MNDENLAEDSGNVKPNIGLEQYYDTIIALVRASLTRDNTVMKERRAYEALMLSRSARGTGSEESDESVPPYIAEPGWHPVIRGETPVPPGAPFTDWAFAEGAGCEFVDIARLGDLALVAFHWYETADETFVRVVNLRDFADRDFAAGMADTIITVNLFENLGNGWHLHHSLKRIRGLTFLE
jgi:hypothetical protein